MSPRRQIAVEDLMDIEPIGDRADEVGRRRDGAFEWSVPVVGVCDHCGAEIHEKVTGHGCVDGFRDHRDGEGITEVDFDA